MLLLIVDFSEAPLMPLDFADAATIFRFFFFRFSSFFAFHFSVPTMFISLSFLFLIFSFSPTMLFSLIR